MLKPVDLFLDLIFPKFCVGCGTEGSFFCPDCQKKIIFIRYPTCPVCQRKTRRGNFCSRHRKKFALSGVITAAYFHEGPLREAIHGLKYEFLHPLARDLGEILFTATANFWPKASRIFVPVPLHWLRRTQRGFNQAELLCRELIIHHPQLTTYNSRLIRKKYTLPQVTVSESERQKNVTGAFCWRGKEELKGKKILLVDDVTTTLATLNECARILRLKAGGREVWGLVLAKG